MKKINIRFYSKINEKYRKHILKFIFIIFITTLILTILAIRQPLEVEEKVIANTLEEKTFFDYKAKVKPSILYPNGGIITPDKVIFNNLTEDFIIELNTEINAEKPVRVEASKEVSYKLIAEKMWEREFIVNQAEKYNFEGLSHNIINNDVHINISEINNFIAKIEEETLVRPNYIITVKSSVMGNVYDENNNVIHEINNNLEVPFDFSGQYISYAGETEEKELVNTKLIEQINRIPQKFNLLGMNLSIINSRIVFGIFAIISFILLIIYVIEKLSLRPNQTQINLIDKKNKGNIVTITNKIEIETMPHVTVKSYKDLMKIAEEKDESILKYIDNTLDIVYYYITSSSFIYIFKSMNVVKGSEQIQDA